MFVGRDRAGRDGARGVSHREHLDQDEDFFLGAGRVGGGNSGVVDGQENQMKWIILILALLGVPVGFVLICAIGLLFVALFGMLCDEMRR